MLLNQRSGLMRGSNGASKSRSEESSFSDLTTTVGRSTVSQRVSPVSQSSSSLIKCDASGCSIIDRVELIIAESSPQTRRVLLCLVSLLVISVLLYSVMGSGYAISMFSLIHSSSDSHHRLSKSSPFSSSSLNNHHFEHPSSYSIRTQIRNRNELSFLVIGDWGCVAATPIDRHGCDDYVKRLSQSMCKVEKQLGSDFVISVGDNFYDNGLKFAKKENNQGKMSDDQLNRIKKTWQSIYDCSDNPWYLTVGNHDVRGSVTAQILFSDYSKKRWNMPARFFVQDFPLPSTINRDMISDDHHSGPLLLRLLFVDTNTLLCGMSDLEKKQKLSSLEQFECSETHSSVKQVSSDENVDSRYNSKKGFLWLEQNLQKAQNDPRVHSVMVVGHHPLMSQGPHSVPPYLTSLMLPMMLHYNVSAFFCGHNHGLEHFYISGIIQDDTQQNQHHHSKLNLANNMRGLHQLMSGAAGFTPDALHPMDGPVIPSKLPLLDGMSASVQSRGIFRQMNGFLSVRITSDFKVLFQFWDVDGNEISSSFVDL